MTVKKIITWDSIQSKGNTRDISFTLDDKNQYGRHTGILYLNALDVRKVELTCMLMVSYFPFPDFYVHYQFTNVHY